MSKGKSCTCTGRISDKKNNWIIVNYRCNYSAFNGYKYTPSDYSLLNCKKCGHYWRTKSNYVNSVRTSVIN